MAQRSLHSTEAQQSIKFILFVFVLQTFGICKIGAQIMQTIDAYISKIDNLCRISVGNFSKVTFQCTLRRLVYRALLTFII